MGYCAYTRDYIRPNSSAVNFDDAEQADADVEQGAYELLCTDIRADLFASLCVVSMTDLTNRFVDPLKVVKVKRQTKNSIPRKLERDFKGSLKVFQN